MAALKPNVLSHAPAGGAFPLLLVAAAMAFLPSVAHAQTGFQEYELKAAYLYNFAQFVVWPPQALPEDGSPFVIGVLGRDPFGRILDEIVAGEDISGHPLKVRRFRHMGEVDVCHILFVGRSEAARLDRILPAVAGRPILMVSDAEDFADRGGTVAFYRDQNRIQLRINLEAARVANLAISSKLLRLAQLVEAEGAPR